MPLVPPVTPQDVASVGALEPFLFDIPDQPSFEMFLQGCIDFSDSWMQGHMGASYGLAQFAWQVNLQRRGQIYLALEAAVDTLKAKKTYGSHAAFVSEDSGAYEALIENDWGMRAIEALDLWVTVEQLNRNFALPLFLTSTPLEESDTINTAIDPQTVQLSLLLDKARGISNANIGTITR